MQARIEERFGNTPHRGPRERGARASEHAESRRALIATSTRTAIALILLLMAGGCRPLIPDGIFGCTTSADCPTSFTCVANFCRRGGGIDAGQARDAAMTDAGRDSGSRDAGCTPPGCPSCSALNQTCGAGDCCSPLVCRAPGVCSNVCTAAGMTCTASSECCVSLVCTANGTCETCDRCNPAGVPTGCMTSEVCTTDAAGCHVCQPLSREGEPCANNTECQPGLFCASGLFCARACTSDAECGTSALGPLCLVNVFGSGNRLCAGQPCNPVNNTTCGATNRCEVLGYAPDGRIGSLCIPMDASSPGEFEPCSLNEIGACRAGHHCENPSFSGICRAWCYTNADCVGDGRRCIANNVPAFTFAGNVLGMCGCDTATPCISGATCIRNRCSQGEEGQECGAAGCTTTPSCLSGAAPVCRYEMCLCSCSLDAQCDGVLSRCNDIGVDGTSECVQ